MKRTSAHHRLSELKLVRIGKPIRWRALERLAEHVQAAFGRVLGSVETVERETLPVEEIEAGLLTQALAVEVGGHILAVTEIDLVDSRSEDFSRYMFGGKDNRNDVAVVSTRRLQRPDRPLPLERLIKVALHELGHNFGLVHHYSLVDARDGYCPMTKGDFNRYGERGYLRAVVDARGFSFCRDCLRFIEARALLSTAG